MQAEIIPKGRPEQVQTAPKKKTRVENFWEGQAARPPLHVWFFTCLTAVNIQDDIKIFAYFYFRPRKRGGDPKF